MTKPVICIGGALVDELFYAADKMVLHTTNHMTVKKIVGGVGYNIAHQLSLLNIPVQLITVLGEDPDGKWIKNICAEAGINIIASVTTKNETAKYTGILNADGSLFTALLSNSSFSLITPYHLEQQRSLLSTAAYLLADGNISADAINWLIDFSNCSGIPLIIEPVSVPHAKKIGTCNLKGVYLITPNEDELPALCNATTTEEQINELLERGVENIWLHSGIKGSAIYNAKGKTRLHATKIDVVDCTGAGDGSLSAFIMSKYIGKNDLESLKAAHTLSAEILQVNGAIANHIDQKKLLQLIPKYYSE
ncbi:MAG: PfkB family carbohydrate kinase [Bacteroidota bacterium]